MIFISFWVKVSFSWILILNLSNYLAFIFKEYVNTEVTFEENSLCLSIPKKIAKLLSYAYSFLNFLTNFISNDDNFKDYKKIFQNKINKFNKILENKISLKFKQVLKILVFV